MKYYYSFIQHYINLMDSMKINDSTIQSYLDSLPRDILGINLSYNNLSFIPELSSFTCLKRLYCKCNQLTTLPALPPCLIELWCSQNHRIMVFSESTHNSSSFTSFLNTFVFLGESTHYSSCLASLLNTFVV